MAEYGLARPFTAVIGTDGTIYEAGLGRDRSPVGIDAQREAELQSQISDMQSVLDEYYNKLVQLGEIVPVKSAEQIASEQAAAQAEINRELLEAIKDMKAELSSLKASENNESSKYSTECRLEHREEQRGEDSEVHKPSGSGRKTGNRQGSKPAAGSAKQ